MNKKFTAAGLFLFLLTVCLFYSPGFSQSKDTKPQGIIPKPGKKSDLEVKMSTDHSLYKPREEVTVSYEVSQTAFLYLYSIDTRGDVTLLFPNRYDSNNKVKPGKGELPGRGYSFLTGKEKGREYFQIIASKVELPVFPSPGSNNSNTDPFINLAKDPAVFEDITTRKINTMAVAKNWDTDWVSVEVTRKTARLSITSSPSNARIYVDGDFVGTTPDVVDVRPGERDVKLLLGTDLKWQGKVNAKPNQVKNVAGELERVNYSSILIKTTPAGAGITINGDYRGKTPRRIPVESGEINVELEKEGYRSREEEIQLYPNETRTIDVRLDIETKGNSRFDVDVPVQPGLNAGFVNPPLSFGADISVNNWVIGGSLRFTGSSKLNDIRINWKEENYRGEKLNYGPEMEIYAGYLIGVFKWLNLEVGAGLAVQTRARLQQLSTSGQSFDPLADVFRNAQRIYGLHPTLQGGFSFKQKGFSLQFNYHSRRGPVFGFRYRF